MEITLKAFEDLSMYDKDDVDSISWQLQVNGADVGDLNSYEDIHSVIGLLLQIEERLAD